MRFSRSPWALLAALLFATAASALLSPAKLHCLRSRNLELARLTGCGEARSVAHCLDMLPDDLAATDLERCYIHAGCEPVEAIVESRWILDRCGDDGKMPAELRKRHVPVLARRTAEPKAAAGADHTATNGAHSATRSTLICSTPTTVSTTLCPTISTGANSGMTLKHGCFPTQVVFPTCAAGLLCHDDAEGKSSSCMELDNTVHRGGVAVALFFGVAITSSISWITFLCCGERRQRKRFEARAETAALAREAAKGPSVLVKDTESQAPMMHGLTDAGSNAHGPFSDQQRI